MKKVFIKELNAFGEVIRTDGNGAPRVVEVKTEEGPKMIDVIEKGYTIISTLKAVLELILSLIKSWKR